MREERNKMELVKAINILQCFILMLSSGCIAYESFMNERPHLINVVVDQNIANSNEIPKDSAPAILNFLDVQSKKFRLGNHKDIILVLGNTGSGRTTLSLLLTDGELDAFEVLAGSGVYLLADKHNRINNNSTTTSKTNVPEMMIDQSSDTIYYDCPGFSDSRGVEYDISASYLIQKLLKFADSVKFVLTINYASMKNGVGDRRDFIDLITHMTTLINDIEKYRNSIALVVMKVQNRKVRRNTKLHLVSDESLIESIAEFLRRAKQHLKTAKYEENEHESIKKKIIIVESLLKKKKEKYERIAILRLANQTGSVENMRLLQEEKQTIRSIMNKNIQYTRIANTDFDFTISDASKNRIHELIIEMHNRLISIVSNIGSEIKEFCTHIEKQCVDISVLYKKMELGHEKLSKVNSPDPKVFAKQIVEAVDTLGIAVSIESLNSFVRDNEFIEFLKTVSNQNITFKFNIANELSSARQYLLDSKLWYEFLMNLHHELSECKVQNEEIQITAAQIVNASSIEDNEIKSVNDIGLQSFLLQINSSSYDKIANLQVNAIKLKALRTVLNETLLATIESICVSDRLVVRGYNVKISDVIKQECPEPIRFIEVFALNTLFIDADFNKTGQKIQLSFISPTWKIVDNRKIILNGKDAETLTGIDAEWLEGGDNGSPGEPGGPGGNFLGIGKRFINDDKLEIHVNGGKGGNGQNGAKGKQAPNGVDPPIEEYLYRSKKRWDVKGFKYVEKEKFDVKIDGDSFIRKIRYEVKGRNGMKGGNGGDGGCGGVGGQPGTIIISGLQDTPNVANFAIFNHTGANGSSGKGGVGGSGAPAGHDMILEYRQTIYYVMPTVGKYTDPKILYWGQLNDGDVGNAGKDGLNRDGIKSAEKLKFVNSTQTISRYKSYVRENLPNNIRESGLRKFLEELDGDEIVLSLQDTMGLVDELNDFESQYFQLRNQIYFVPFVESFSSRISNHMKKVESDENYLNDDVNIMTFLHTAAQSKLSSIRKNMNHISIIDLFEYVDTLGKHIEELRDSKNDVNIVQYHAEYKKSMDSKLDLVHAFIYDGLIPEIEMILREFEQEIYTLLNAVTNQENTSNTDTIDVNKRKLENSLQLYRMLEPVKMTSSVLGFLIKLGRIMADTVSDTEIIAKIFVHDPNYHEDEKLLSIAPNVDSHLDELKDKFKTRYRFFMEELIDIDEELNEYAGDDEDIVEIKNKIAEINDTIDDLLTDTYLQDPVMLESTRQELKDFIINKQSILKIEDDSKFDISRILNLIDLADTTVDMYVQIRDDQEQVQLLIDSLKTKQAKLENWKEIERKVYDTLISELLDVDNIVAILRQSLEEKKEIDLDIGKWNIQIGLIQAKALFHELLINYSDIDINVQHCVERVIDGLDVIIDVYDRIESYSVNSKLDAVMGRVITNLTLDTDSENVNNTIATLKKMIQTNLMLEQYEMTMQTIVQHQFPFGDILLKTFALPSNLLYNDTDKIADAILEKINDLKEQIKSLQISIGKYDREIFRDVEFSSSSTSAASPFYVWKNNEIKTELVKLLQGEEITVKADITKGVNQNAVKFREIGIHFKVVNDTVQNELDAELEHFGVSMTMLGHSYYRCGNRFYFISIDDNIIIDYSMKKGSNGKPSTSNEMYRQINKSNYFLSPYTTWRIKLTNETTGFEKLHHFQYENIDLELIGNGQYFKDGKSFSHEICNDQLDNYYNYDNTIASLDSIEELSIQIEI